MGFFDFMQSGPPQDYVTAPQDAAAFTLPIPYVSDTLPNYIVGQSPLQTPNYVMAPPINIADQSAWSSFAGNVGSFFNAAASGVKTSVQSSSDWFASPSGTATKSIASAASGLYGTVSSFFAGTNGQSSKSNTPTTAAPASPQGTASKGLGVVGALKALVGIGAPPPGSVTLSQAVGDGASNIVGGVTKPLLPVLVLVVVGMVALFLILGRLQRA